MATALAGGLYDSGVAPERMMAIDPDERARERISDVVPGIRSEAEYTHIGTPDTIVIAVKPQIAPLASKALATTLGTHKPLIISIAAGVTLEQLRTWLGADSIVVRCMPNTPALLRCGITALSCEEHIDKAQRARAEQVLGSVGTTTWCSETMMDAVTAVSGSGPAYFFLVTEALIEAGCALGLPKQLAEQLSTHTALGAARMMCHGGVDVTELRKRVTSPGGTTERALEVLQEGKMRNLWADAVKAAAQRSKELASKATH